MNTAEIMDKLPPELWPEILQHLRPADLKSCRFASKSFSTAAALPLFRTVNVSPVKEKFDWLSILPESICLCVRRLRLHRIPLPIFESFALWHEYDPSLSFESVQDLACNRFPASKVESYFHLYQRLDRVTTSHCGYIDSDHLRRTITRFHGLTTLELVEVDLGKFMHPIRDREPFRAMRYEALSNISFQGTRLLGALSDIFTRLSAIELHGLTWLMLEWIEPGDFNHLEASLKNIKHFTISMPKGDHVEPLNQDLSSLRNRIERLLNAAEDLHSLDISCTVVTVTDGCFDISAVRSTWPNLRKLRIAGVNVDGGNLMAFLTRHSSGLRSLELANISLWGNSKFQNIGISWITVIQALREDFCLAEIQFGGALLNGAYDGFEVSPKLSPNGLKDRVEYYIIHGGSCPLPMEDAEFLSEPERVKLLAAFPGDASWRYEEDYYGISVRTW